MLLSKHINHKGTNTFRKTGEDIHRQEPKNEEMGTNTHLYLAKFIRL